MIHDDDNVDSMPELEQIQILPSQPRDLDDVETSMADDAVEALSSGACDSSALELLADVAAMPSCSSRGVGRAPVSMSALGAISIGVSVQTIEESKLDDKEILIDGFWHAQGVATRLKSTYRSNYRGLWPFPDYVTGVLIDPRHVGDVLSQVEEKYTWAFCEHAGESVCHTAFVHRSDLEEIRRGADPTTLRGSLQQRKNLFRRFRTEVQYRTALEAEL